ncbi:MAG: zinc-ribbon domain containing protein [Blastocatellia bacterium]|nr:zinc-ribbon domain containing protein [Blastocatellia bacterium]
MSQIELEGVASPEHQSDETDSEFEDRSILCIDCNHDFIWTVGEQVFFRDKQLLNPPKRCKDCKQAKNERLAAIAAAQASGIKQRIEVAVNCAECQESTTVPFYPSQGRPVYCRSCFIKSNPSVLNGSSTSHG